MQQCVHEMRRTFNKAKSLPEDERQGIPTDLSVLQEAVGRLKPLTWADEAKKVLGNVTSLVDDMVSKIKGNKPLLKQERDWLTDTLSQLAKLVVDLHRANEHQLSEEEAEDGRLLLEVGQRSLFFGQDRQADVVALRTAERRAKSRPTKAISAQKSHARWIENLSKIVTRDGKDCWVRVKRLGDLAIHECLPDSQGNKVGMWAVTHMPTSRLACKLPSERNARKVAEVINRHRVALKCRYVGSVRADLPPWVARWLQACQQVGKYIDPEPFEQESVRGQVRPSSD
jgi:hypothetical protein